MRVLVVDDYRDTVELMVALVRAKGHEAWLAQDGFEALERAAEVRPELILLDICMPGIDGYETARRLRRQDGLAGVPIYALSASPVDEQRARAAGMDGHFMKPLRFTDLKELLNGASAHRAHS